MSSNIKNFNFNKIDLRLSNSEYWDFYLAHDENSSDCYECEIPDECLISEFDFNSGLSGDTIISSVAWSGATDVGNVIPTYGLTGLDNGAINLILNPLDLTNQNLVDALTGTTLTTNQSNLLILNRVSGYTNSFSYPLNFNNNQLNLQGGFYQGFYKLEGYDYQVLPNRVNKGIVYEFELLKNDSIITGDVILNNQFPNNKGIFMYLGSRAENKFWNQFDGLNTGSTSSCTIGASEYCTIPKETDVRVINDYGYPLPLNPPQINFTEVNNEFLLYGRASKNCNQNLEDFKLGTLKACDVTGDTPTFIVSSTTQTITNTLNPFLIFGRSKGKTNCSGRPSDGYGRETVCSFSGYTSDLLELDKDADIIDNALAFMIKDNGSIGYRLLTITASCVDNKTVTGTTIQEEFSEPDLIQDGEWTRVAIRFTTNYYDDCELKYNKRRFGRLMFYIDCKLKFVVDNFPEFIARGLNEYKEKQVGVPYNISIGGGSQGLLESMTFDGQDPADLGLAIETNFAGSFIGSMRSFRIYECDLNWCEISKLCPQV